MRKNTGIKEAYTPDYQLLARHGQMQVLADLQF